MPAITRSKTSTKAKGNSGPLSALLQRKDQYIDLDTYESNRPVRRNDSASPDTPPRFTINLALPPEQRYLEVCAAYQTQLQTLVALFDEVMIEIAKYVPLRWIERVCRLCLRRVYDDEENRELKGISRATGIEMYLLVCFNVLLDLFMGCSSGGAAVRDPSSPEATKMLHFRTLDWGMPSLRKVVVQLDYQTESGGPIVASTITYVGYVGVLTGVKKGLSVSLNFRPTRDRKYEVWPDTKYYWHLFLVLLGRRRSISSQIRQFVVPKLGKKGHAGMEYAQAVSCIGGSATSRPMRSTACYLCVSDGRETTVFEKDLMTAKVRSDHEFIVVTNNDSDLDSTEEDVVESSEASEFASALEELIYEAKDRRQCAIDNYRRRRADKSTRRGQGDARVMELEDVIWLVQRFPTTNEATHYACVMDPQAGSILWAQRWQSPISAKWIRAHEG